MVAGRTERTDGAAVLLVHQLLTSAGLLSVLVHDSMHSCLYVMLCCSVPQQLLAPGCLCAQCNT
jgi:hypothetical protein